MAGFFKSLYNKLANKAEIDWDDLEAELVAADLGPKLAMQIILELRDLGRQVTAEDVIDVARRQVSDRSSREMLESSRAAATPDCCNPATWSVIRAIRGETTRPRPGRTMLGIW